MKALATLVVAGCVMPEAPTDSNVQPIWSGEFEAGAADSPVSIDSIATTVDVWDTHASGCTQIAFSADEGADMSAALRFALPRGAVIHRAELSVGGLWERAETLGRREGEAVFEDELQPEPVAQDPLLVQQIALSAYRARVYPVGIDQNLLASVCWVEALEQDDQGERLSVSLGDPSDPEARTVRELDVEVTLHETRWVGGSWSARVGDAEASAGHARFHASSFPLSERVVLNLDALSASQRLLAIAYDSPAPDVDDRVFVRWMPDFSEYPSTLPLPRNVVFVVDVSGSMLGAKLAETQRAVTEALEALGPSDVYSLVSFSDTIGEFRATPTPGDDVADAQRWVSSLVADGSTNIAAGLTRGAAIGAQADADVPIDLVLVTDGRPTAGASTTDAILAELRAAIGDETRPVRVFAAGIGQDLDQGLLNGLVQETDGEATFALDDSEIWDQFLDLFSRVRGGGADDVVIELSGGGIDGIETFAWPRVFPWTPIALGARGAEVTGPVSVVLHAVAPNGADVEIASSGTPVRGDGEELLAAAPLAAETFGARLNRTIDETLETDALVGEAVVNAKEHGILGRYSSLLGMESDDMFEEHGIDRIARDPAGIALEDVTASVSDESRIGGSGVDDTSAGPSGGDADADWAGASDGGEHAAGCGCRTATGPSGADAVFALSALVALRGARRRRRERE